MRILPVLDVRGGIVVRAVGGRRSEYRPLVSRLTDSTEPLVVAEAIRAKFGWSEFYVADLDAITDPGVPFDKRLIDHFHAAGFRLWLDGGVREPADAERLAAAGIHRVVVGLETLGDLAYWPDIVRRIGPDRAVFSLDLKHARPLTGEMDPLDIAESVITEGGRQLVVLDLARVGTNDGPGTEAICTDLLRRHPGIAVYAGGGIRDIGDVHRLDAIGVAGLLLSSALHDGKELFG